MTQQPISRKKRKTMLWGILGAVVVLNIGIVAYALTDTVSYYKVPGELIRSPVSPNTRLRLGGFVKEGSLNKSNPMQITFEAFDAEATIKVTYDMVAGTQLPDLFKEGQGMVAEGYLVSPGLFKADKILAKHDEKYVAREVADKLKEQGHWMAEEEVQNP